MKQVIKDVVLIAFVFTILVVGKKSGVIFNRVQVEPNQQFMVQNQSVNIHGLEKTEGDKNKLNIVTKENGRNKRGQNRETITESTGTAELLQEETLPNATLKIEFSGEDGMDDWHSTKPSIIIEHPGHESYPKEEQQLTTHFELYEVIKGKETLLESKQFVRTFREETYEVTDNIVEPVIDHDGEYYITVWTSTASAQSKKQSYPVKVDQYCPEKIKLFYSTEQEDGFVKSKTIHGRKYLFYNDKTTVSFQGSDEGGSGIAYYKYQFIPLKEKPDQRGWNKTEKPYVVVPSDFKGSLLVTAVDYAGNESTICNRYGDDYMEECFFVVDKEKPKQPKIHVWGTDKDYKGGEWVGSQVAIQVFSEPKISGIEKYQYTTVKNPLEKDWNEFSESGKGTLCFDCSLHWVNDKITIEHDTNKTYYFRAVSEAGMISETSQITVRVQITKPQKPEVSITPEKSDGNGAWYCTIPKIKISHPKRTENNKNTAPFTTCYQFYKVEKESEKESQVIREFKESDNIKCPVIGESGTYILKVWTKDITGSCCETSNGKGYEQYQIQVDAKAPDVTILMNEKEVNSNSDSDTYNLFLRQNTKVTVKCFDQNSGVEKIEYQKVVPGDIFDQNKEWIEGNEFDIKENEAFIVYFRVTDQAGNKCIVKSDGIIMDQQKPEGENKDAITVIPRNVNENGISNQDVPIDIVVKDPAYAGIKRSEQGICSGIKKVSYSILKDGNTLKQKTLYEYEKQLSPYEELVKEFKHTVVVKASEFEGNHLVVVVNAEDNAGNKTSNECTFSIDQTKPVLTLVYNKDEAKNKKYYNKARAAVLTIREKNFNAEKLQILIKRNNRTLDSNNFNIHKEGKDYKALLLFKEDGVYEVSISCEDEVGNEADYNRVDEFVIDTKNPEIKVNYQDGTGKSGKYYKSSRIAKVEIYEQNYGEDAKVSISAMHQGQIMKAPEPKEWRRRGDYYTTSIVYEEDGEYRCNIMATDLAGNTAVYQEEAPFFVDCNAPDIMISGVENCSANREEVIPVIRVKDTYMEPDSIEVHLTGTKTGEIAKEIKPVIDGGEYKLIYDIFEKTKEMDDIYTLTVMACDCAGNKRKKEIMFSVNRFGSTYTMEKQCADIVNQYIKEATEFIIIETNPDFLKQYFIKCSRNGTVYDLTENVNYRVVKSGTEHTWKQYRFIINKETFKEEGFYTISLYSVDAADNKSDNQSKNREFQFVVDKTSPICIITGVKDRQSYRDEKQKVYFKLEDNSFIDSVSLEVNNIVVREFKREQIEKRKGEFEYEISSRESLQDIKLCCVDVAGNKSVETVEKFLITTNPWVQFYNDKTRLYVVIVCVGGVIILCGSFFFIKKEKIKRSR